MVARSGRITASTNADHRHVRRPAVVGIDPAFDDAVALHALDEPAQPGLAVPHAHQLRELPEPHRRLGLVEIGEHRVRARVDPGLPLASVERLKSASGQSG